MTKAILKFVHKKNDEVTPLAFLHSNLKRTLWYLQIPIPSYAQIHHSENKERDIAFLLLKQIEVVRTKSYPVLKFGNQTVVTGDIDYRLTAEVRNINGTCEVTFVVEGDDVQFKFRPFNAKAFFTTMFPNDELIKRREKMKEARNIDKNHDSSNS